MTSLPGLQAILSAVIAAGGTEADIQALVGNPDKLSEIAGIILRKPGTYADLERRFDMVFDGYDRITKIVTISVRRDVPDTDNVDDLELIEIDCDTWSTEQVRADIISHGSLPASFNEGLLYAQRHPQAQIKHPYVTLATELVIGGIHTVPFFYGRDGKRGLDADRIPGVFRRIFRCLVRKVA